MYRYERPKLYSLGINIFFIRDSWFFLNNKFYGKQIKDTSCFITVFYSILLACLKEIKSQN